MENQGNMPGLLSRRRILETLYQSWTMKNRSKRRLEQRQLSSGRLFWVKMGRKNCPCLPKMRDFLRLWRDLTDTVPCPVARSLRGYCRWPPPSDQPVLFREEYDVSGLTRTVFSFPGSEDVTGRLLAPSSMADRDKVFMLSYTWMEGWTTAWLMRPACLRSQAMSPL